MWECIHTVKEPTNDRARLWRAIEVLLERAVWPGPLAQLELELGELTAESGRQSTFFADHGHKRELLDQTVQHLNVRYPQFPLKRVVEVEPWSRIPERRSGLLDYAP